VWVFADNYYFICGFNDIVEHIRRKQLLLLLLGALNGYPLAEVLINYQNELSRLFKASLYYLFPNKLCLWVPHVPPEISESISIYIGTGKLHQKRSDFGEIRNISDTWVLQKVQSLFGPQQNRAHFITFAQ
jgi:hypothetical protein